VSGKVFNLDEIVQEPQVVVWKDNAYQVKEPTVLESIEFQRILQEMDASDAATVFGAISKAVAFMIPGLPVDEIPSRRLMDLLAFVREGFGRGGDEKNAQAGQERASRKNR
jgi:hypothetical protein